MATATTTKRTRIFYTVQEISTRPWSEPVGNHDQENPSLLHSSEPVGNRVWTWKQAKKIESILLKQGRKCFRAQIRLYV